MAIHWHCHGYLLVTHNGYKIYNDSTLLETIANITSYTINDVSQDIVYDCKVSPIDKRENEVDKQ